MNPLTPKKKYIYLMLLPGLIVFIFAVILPLFMSVRYSLYQWSGGSSMEFLALDNYLTLLSDSQFWHAFRNNLFIVFLNYLI